MNCRAVCLLAVLVSSIAVYSAATDDLRLGYYRQPAIHGDTLVFVAEGDLWRVGTDGGAAVRLTTHAEAESGPVISGDGSVVAFVARYEGPAALYTMPLTGGGPTRWTWGASRLRTVGWTLDGRLIYATDEYSTLPDMQLIELDVETGDDALVPLAQADDGCYDDSGTDLFFTRYRFQGSNTKRYHGGTAQRLWRYSDGEAEAVLLTADHPGTSRDPMWWSGRVYFASDRDGTLNIWTMLPDGGDLQQHTTHAGWEVLGPSLSEGRIAYQLGADIRILDLATGEDAEVPIQLVSDFDQTRENWVDEPIDYLTTAHLSADGERVALTARGQVFVAPRKQGRLVNATRAEGVRFREARFMPDGERIVALSDESQEVELWTVPANGVGERAQLTDNGEVLRWQAIPSPDGKLIAHHDKNYRLFIYDVEHKTDTLVDSSEIDGFSGFAWSPDSRWLAYVAPADNLSRVIKLYRVEDGLRLTATTDRYDSSSPAFSTDGKWLYLLSDRHLRSVVRSPWGPLQPEPFFDKRTKIYALALEEDLRSPFKADDELHVATSKDGKKNDKDNEIDLSHWSLSVSPREEWRQMFVESWRLERDYFYDRKMHGVEWREILDRYLPLVDRVRSRGELSDLMAQMASELAAIHTFVYGGDHREGDDDIAVASLGARLVVDETVGGWRVEHVYRSDPDEPGRRSPLTEPGVDISAGDVIVAVNGAKIAGHGHPAALLRNQTARQVLLRIRPGDGGAERDVIVVPISDRSAGDLRYHEWEYTRRLAVDEASGGSIGYVHLRAMGAANIAEWARGYYPVFNRPGLIIDVRHNRGGNIDSWIIEKLIRKAWGAWSDRVAKPTMTNMQYAFRGHLIFLCDAWTASDGEAFLEAVRRLDLGPIMGIRTWGGGIWLTSSNRLVDGGIVTAAEFGLFGPDGVWVVEGDGITPDIIVDNLPHATFAGKDAQLEAAVDYLLKKIAEEPIPPLTEPPAKDLSLKP
jgi:tricorn protease-like protein